MARTRDAVEYAARREAILDAVQGLVLSKGYEDMTVQDVLDRLQISKGAFYHYFDGKSAAVDALTDRLVAESERVLAPIAADGESDAVDKLRRLFDETVRWKSARHDLFAAMLPVWYAPENVAFRLKVDTAAANMLAPLLTKVVRQGVDEGRFTTGFVEQIGMVIAAIVRALQDAMAKVLLEAARRAPDASAVEELIAIHGAHLHAIERSLDIPNGALGRVGGGPVAADWIAAVRQACAATTTQ